MHGLSTAVHLAELQGSGERIVVLDKQRVGAGASGISGGIVRNFYLAPEMNEIVRRSVEIFELDPGVRNGYTPRGERSSSATRMRSRIETMPMTLPSSTTGRCLKPPWIMSEAA